MTDETPGFSWGHINLNVRSLDRSVEFYSQLGFESFMPGIPYLGLTSEPEAMTLADSGASALGLLSVLFIHPADPNWRCRNEDRADQAASRHS